MKRALRNVDTAMFIKSDGGETEFMDQARSFENYQDAIEFCNKNKLKGVELVVKMSDNYEFTVEVAPQAAPADNT